VIHRLLLAWEAMTCERAVELMTDYLEGAMDRRERARFERHLSRCAACTAYLRQMRATVDAVGHLPAETLPADVRQELIGLYRAFRR
jgi:anti-sigma factor RsiW